MYFKDFLENILSTVTEILMGISKDILFNQILSSQAKDYITFIYSISYATKIETTL